MPGYPHIYLASRSPRRRELLEQIGVSYEILLLREHHEREPDINEDPLPGEMPEAYVRRVCETKARTAWRRITARKLPPHPVLSADTTVCIDGVILGKPADNADALRMLRILSGREHRVLSAVALQSTDKRLLAISDTRVRFRDIPDAELAAYVASGEPMGKAGAYAIQGRAAVFVAMLNGSYSGVMGLPLYETADLLRKFQP
jgi:septum formation protein